MSVVIEKKIVVISTKYKGGSSLCIADVQLIIVFVVTHFHRDVILFLKRVDLVNCLCGEKM